MKAIIKKKNIMFSTPRPFEVKKGGFAALFLVLLGGFGGSLQGAPLPYEKVLGLGDSQVLCYEQGKFYLLNILSRHFEVSARTSLGTFWIPEAPCAYFPMRIRLITGFKLLWL